MEAAWAEDGTSKRIEDPARRILVGVQWRAEAGEEQGL